MAHDPTFDSLPLAAFVTDARGHVTRWNPAAEALTGRSAPSVVGKPAWMALASAAVTVAAPPMSLFIRNMASVFFRL